jgi:hypothetical protein
LDHDIRVSQSTDFRKLNKVKTLSSNLKIMKEKYAEEITSIKRQNEKEFEDIGNEVTR